MPVISHGRDLLNNVADHILHLKGGKTKLYPGGHDAFEKQSAGQAARAASVRAKQLAERERLQAFVNRWRAKALEAATAN